MRPNPLHATALGACLLLLTASCGGDGGPTGPGPQVTGPGTPAAAPRLVLVSGGNQTGAAGRPLPQPVVVRVVDALDRPMAGSTLTFAAEGGGSVSPAQVQTGADGQAQAVWSLSTQPRQQMKVSLAGGAELMVEAATAEAAVAVARVQVLPDSLVLDVGQTGNFNAAAYDSADNVLTGREVAWSTSDSTIATIAADGTVTAVAPGSAQMTATVEGVSASVTVRVRAPTAASVASVQVLPDSLVLDVGQTGDFNAVAFDSAGNALTGRAVTWSSSDPGIATVGAGGAVAAVAAGSAQVTATVEGVSASGTVIVRTPPPTIASVARVEVLPDSLVLDVGQTGDFNAIAYDSAGNALTGRAVTWSSSDPSVATVGAGGAVTAVAAGSAQVTATVEGVGGSATVRVRTPPPTIVRVARVEVLPDSLVLDVGQTGDFNAIAYDSAGNALTGRAVTWSSSDPSIATVGAGGAVTAVAAGSAQVTATVEGVGGSATVRVRTPPPTVARVARVEVSPDSLLLNVGETGDFNATAYDSAGNVLTGRTVAWSSSNPAVATVGTGGSVAGVAVGTARVIATVEGVSGSATVRVRTPPPAPVARVQVVPDSLVLEEGQTGDFGAVAFDSAGNVLTGRAVAWSSSDATVVEVNAAGTVTARSAGAAQVTATVEGVSGSAAVRVRGAAVARVWLRPDSVVVEVGHTGRFTALAFDTAGNLLTGRAVAWSASDAAVARVAADGTVTGVAVGRAQVTATVEGASFSAPVRVIPVGPIKVARVEVMPDSFVVNIGGMGRFTAVAYDTAGNVLTGRPVTWYAFLPDVATVDAGGTVTGVGEGQVRIMATVEGAAGSGIVRVRGIPAARVDRVRVVPDSLVLDVGQTGSFTAVAYDSAGNALTGRRVTWASSDASRVTFGSGGTVAAVGSGTVTVTANVEGITGTGTVRVRTQAPALVTWIQKRVGDLRSGAEGGLIDVSETGRTVNFTIDLSRRVREMSLRVRGPDGTTIPCGRAEAVNYFYNEFRCSLYIPARSAPGVWIVDRLTVEETVYDPAGLAATRVPGRAFDVFRTGPDNAPPQVRTLWPSGMGWNNGRYYVAIGLVDHVTGVHRASMTLRGPGGQALTCADAYPASGGLARGGSWICGFDIPADAADGAWRLESVTAVDGVGNTATYTPAQIEALRGVFEYTFIATEFPGPEPK